MSDIVVIGGGVSGLSCAIELHEAGFRPRVWSSLKTRETTSHVAAALWYPYLAQPMERIVPWSLRSYEVFSELAADPESGILFRRTLEVFRKEAPAPAWGDAVRGSGFVPENEVPEGYHSAFACEAPVIEMPRYLPFLLKRLRALGGEVEERRITSLDEAWKEAPILVNCSGLGSRELCDDPELRPIRGQITHLVGHASTTAWVDDADPERPSYVVPRGQDTVLGGSIAYDDPSLEPDLALAKTIRDRCERLEPGLRDLAKHDDQVGQRPGRSAVRLESERLADGRGVVHDYGHGGCGVTLSWGCAAEVVEKVRELMEARP